MDRPEIIGDPTAIKAVISEVVRNHKRQRAREIPEVKEALLAAMKTALDAMMRKAEEIYTISPENYPAKGSRNGRAIIVLILDSEGKEACRMWQDFCSAEGQFSCEGAITEVKFSDGLVVFSGFYHADNHQVAETGAAAFREAAGKNWF